MSARRATFKQSDATRAMRAAASAGLKLRECKIDPDGAIRLIFADGAPVGSANPWDEVLQ